MKLEIKLDNCEKTTIKLSESEVEELREIAKAMNVPVTVAIAYMFWDVWDVYRDEIDELKEIEIPEELEYKKLRGCNDE